MRGVCGGVVGREMWGKQIWSARIEKGTQKATENMRQWRAMQAVNVPWLSRVYPLYQMLAKDPFDHKTLWHELEARNMSRLAWDAYGHDGRSWVQNLDMWWPYNGDLNGANVVQYDPYTVSWDWTQCWNVPWQNEGEIWAIGWRKDPVYGWAFELKMTSAPNGSEMFIYDQQYDPPFGFWLLYRRGDWEPCSEPQTMYI